MRRKKEAAPTAADARNKNPRHESKKSNAPTTAMRQSREASIRRRRKAAPIGGGRPNQAPATRQRTTAAPRPKGGEPPPTAADARNQTQRYRPKTVRKNENCILS